MSMGMIVLVVMVMSMGMIVLVVMVMVVVMIMVVVVFMVVNFEFVRVSASACFAHNDLFILFNLL